MNDTTPYGSRSASVEYWANNRNSLADLYPSEKHFLASKLPGCRSVLDVGCAAGGFTTVCRELSPGIAYTGLDVSMNLVERAKREHAGQDVEFSVYDGRQFPAVIADRHFDLVYSFGVLHHVPHWPDIVAQMIDVARRFVCFDLRLAFDGTARGHQIIDFNEEWDGATRIDYLVEDFFETLSRLYGMLGEDTGLELFGYERPPTDKAKVEKDSVVMASFLVDKTTGKRNMKVDVSR